MTETALPPDLTRRNDAHRVWLRTVRLQAPWRLEPLHARHAGELAVQYRNPQTATLTGLPAIDEGFDAVQWIAARNAESPATYALIHDRFGFVGYGDLFLDRDEGYVCFWLGEDYRGRGWSKVLIDHLCALARNAGLSVIWSSAYRSNQASLHAMAGAGFRTLDLRALPPDEERSFVFLPLSYRSLDSARDGMVAFCDRTDTGVRFEPPAPARAIRSPSLDPSGDLS